MIARRIAPLAAALVLAACSTGGSTSPPVTQPASVAGEYAGTLKDSAIGTQSAGIALSEHGSAAGGTLTFGSGAAAESGSVSLAISGNTLNGSATFDVNGSACTIAMSATYAGNTLSGTYTPVTPSCLGRNGSFTLTQTCAGVSAAAARKPQDVIPFC